MAQPNQQRKSNNNYIINSLKCMISCLHLRLRRHACSGNYRIYYIEDTSVSASHFELLLNVPSSGSGANQQRQSNNQYAIFVTVIIVSHLPAAIWIPNKNNTIPINKQNRAIRCISNTIISIDKHSYQWHCQNKNKTNDAALLHGRRNHPPH